MKRPENPAYRRPPFLLGCDDGRITPRAAKAPNKRIGRELMFSRREMLRSAALASLSMPFVARGSFAQEAWPAREIHAICGFPPGTGADIFVRHYARKLQEVSGKSV